MNRALFLCIFISVIAVGRPVPAAPDACHGFAKVGSANEESITSKLDLLGLGHHVWIIGKTGVWGIPFQSGGDEKLTSLVLERLRTELARVLSQTSWIDPRNSEVRFTKRDVSPEIMGLRVTPISVPADIVPRTLALEIMNPNPSWPASAPGQVVRIFRRPLPDLDALRASATCTVIVQLTGDNVNEPTTSTPPNLSKKLITALSLVASRMNIAGSNINYAFRPYSLGSRSPHSIDGYELAISFLGRESDVRLYIAYYRELGAELSGMK